MTNQVNVSKLNKEAVKLIDQVEGCAVTIAQNYEELRRLNKEAVKKGGMEYRNFEAGYGPQLESLKGIMQAAHHWFTWERFTR